MQLTLTGRLDNWPSQGKSRGQGIRGEKEGKKKERKKKGNHRGNGPWLRQKRESEASPN